MAGLRDKFECSDSSLARDVTDEIGAVLAE